MTAELLDNRYKVLQPLGEGAMGAVYLVEDGTTGHSLAMKVLSRQMGACDKSFLQLKQEFRVMAQLRHPNCCAVYDYGQLPDGAPFLTMEVVPGHGLDEILPVPADRVKPLLAQLLLALGYVHQLGYVHMDIKAANIRLRPDDTLKLMDYGLMEVAGKSNQPIRGTLAYLAPEVVKRGPVDRRADLYSVGALAFELVTGRGPFVSASAMEILRAHVDQAPPRLSSFVPGVDPTLERIVAKLLAKEPLERYQSAYEVLEDLGVEVPAGIGGNLLTSPMFGRDDVLEKLAAYLPEIAAGRAGAGMLVLGEGGIGKSRLLEELRFRTQLDGVAWVAGQAPDRGSVPYGPFVEALRKLLPYAQAQAPEPLLRLAPVLVKLLPEIWALSGLGEVAALPDLDPPSREKLRLQSAVSELLAEVAGPKGLVLALEDWHRADALSGELLDFLRRNHPDAPLLLLVTARRFPEPTPAWASTMDRVELGPLDPRGLWRMVTSMLGSEEVAAPFMSQVAEFAGGNPLMVERLLEHLVHEGLLVATRGRWNTKFTLSPEQVPDDMGAMLVRKLAALSENAQALARTASVFGDAFRLDALQIVSAWRDDMLFDALQALEMAQVLITDESGAYRFAQSELQRQLYDGLQPDDRATLHAAVVVSVEARVQGRKPADLAIEDVTSLATHSLRAGASDKAIVYALEAGTRSAALGAWADAEQFLGDGLGLLRLADGTRWRRQLLSYLQVLGDVRRFLGRSKDAKEVFAEAIDLAEELGLLRELGLLLGSQAKACLVLTEYAVALEYCQRGIAVSRGVGDDPSTGRSLLTAGRLQFFLGNVSGALEAASQAVEVAKSSRDTTIMGAAYAWAGYCCVASSDPEKIPAGIEQLASSLTLLEQAGDKLGLINSYNLLGNAQNMLGEHIQAWESFVKTRAMSYEAGAKSDEVVAVINLSSTALDLGNLKEAKSRADEAVTLSVKYDAKYATGYAGALGALASIMQGDGADAGLAFERALAHTREIKNKYVESLILQYQVEALLELGRLDDALAAGKVLRELIEATGNTEPETRLNVLLSEVHARRGELADAGWRADSALASSTASLAKGMQVRALRAKALTALAAEDWDGARVLAESALSLGESIGVKYLNAHLSGLLGELALASGTPGAVGHFRAMAMLAGQTDARVLGAIAGFGRAAATPYAPDAAELAVAARAEMATLTMAVPEAHRAAFVSLTERGRVMAGDVIGFSLPRRLADRARAFVVWLQGWRGLD